MILVTVWTTVGLALLISETQQPKYQAEAQVFVATSEINSSVGTVPILSVDPDRLLTTQAEMARIPDVVELAAKAAKTEITADELLGSSTVTAGTGADTLKFTVIQKDRELAETLANAYAQGYVQHRQRLDTESLRQARAEIDDQIEELKSAGGVDAANTAESGALADLLQQSSSLRTRELLRASNNSLGGPASAVKVQPKPFRNVSLGLILGLMLGIGLAFLREALNTRVRNAEEVEDRLGMALIGRIPPPPKRMNDSQRIAALEKPYSSQAEAYRILATNIDLQNIDRGARSIAVLSPGRAEGKTTTVASLGVSFARRGLNVTILEGDIRRPNLRKAFGVPGEQGLTDVGLGRVALDKALVQIEVVEEEEDLVINGPAARPGRLDVLFSGATPPSPAEFLKSTAVTNIVARLSARSDLLLVDTPPFLQLSDAATMMLTSKIDAAIIAIRLGKTRRHAISDMKRSLDTVPVVKLGFLTTGAESLGSYGGGYRYYAYTAEKLQPASGAANR